MPVPMQSNVAKSYCLCRAGLGLLGSSGATSLENIQSIQTRDAVQLSKSRAAQPGSADSACCASSMNKDNAVKDIN